MEISKEEKLRILNLHESYRNWNGSLIKEQLFAPKKEEWYKGCDEIIGKLDDELVRKVEQLRQAITGGGTREESVYEWLKLTNLAEIKQMDPLIKCATSNQHPTIYERGKGKETLEYIRGDFSNNLFGNDLDKVNALIDALPQSSERISNWEDKLPESPYKNVIKEIMGSNDKTKIEQKLLGLGTEFIVSHNKQPKDVKMNVIGHLKSLGIEMDSLANGDLQWVVKRT
jgi:hypothetical protein